jgi:ectoine hydroxylase-related dioxygenase (phytanoyl-CoA dioxygenase family)
MAHALTPNRVHNFDLQSYLQNGFEICKALFSSEEVSALRHDATALESACGALVHENPRVRIDIIDGKARPKKIEPLIDVSPEFARLAHDPRIIEIMRSIFQEEPVLFEDKLNYKYPRGGGEFALHQDRWYWQSIPTRQIASILIYMDDATAENGCLEVYAQAHRNGLFEMHPKKGISETVFAGRNRSQALGAAGTAIVFDSMTPHLSKENHSEKFRRAIIFSYNPKADGCFYDAGCGMARDAHRKWMAEQIAESK